MAPRPVPQRRQGWKGGEGVSDAAGGAFSAELAAGSPWRQTAKFCEECGKKLLVAAVGSSALNRLDVETQPEGVLVQEEAKALPFLCSASASGTRHCPECKP